MRNYPPLPHDLAEQLLQVPASHDDQAGVMVYRPCAVTLRDGRQSSRVYVVESTSYMRVWGVDPDDDPAKESVPMADVAAIRESPDRLPAHLADQLYEAGESGMGYFVFTVEFSDGTRQAYVTGNAVDFITAPAGLRAADAVAVTPHEGRQTADLSQGPDYGWCLYGPVQDQVAAGDAA